MENNSSQELQQSAFQMSLSLSFAVKIKFFQFSTQTQAEEEMEAGKCTDHGSASDAQLPTKEMGRVLHNILQDPQTCDPLDFPRQSKSDHQWGGCEDSDLRGRLST